MDTISDAPPPHPVVSRRALFFGFLEVGLSGFGGVLPFARRMVVERRGWLTEQEFTEYLGLGQVLPGPNIVNLSVAIGQRYHGVYGSILAVGGLMAAPLVIVLLLGMLYAQYGHIEQIRRMIDGVSATAAGLVLATAIKMAMAQPRTWWTVVMGLAAFLGAAWLRWPLIVVLLALAPLGIFSAWRMQGGRGK